MTFRAPNWRYASIWMVVAAIQIAMQAFELHRAMARHHEGEVLLRALIIALWSFVLFLYGWLTSHGKIALGTQALIVQFPVPQKRIEYDQIVGIRNSYTEIGKRTAKKNIVEIEVARLSPEIYPHQYVELCVYESDKFAAELHRRAPHAVFEYQDKALASA